MNLDAPERLLACLLDAPAGVDARLHAPLGVDTGPACTVLVERGYRLRQDGAVVQLDGAGLFSPSRYASAHAARRLDGFGEPLQVWARVPSTNECAHQAAAAGAPHGSVWVAEEQTAGRGRQGRIWTCPPGIGLLFSLLLRPRGPKMAAPQLLPLGLAVACCSALHAATGLDIGIRWPNDLLLRHQKLAGILVEVRSAVPAVVVGVGINVRAADLAQLGLPQATTLGQHIDPVPAREDLLAGVLEAMRAAVDAWERGDADALLARWSRLDVLRGQRVRVVGAGAETLGIATGVTAAGLLRVRLADGTERTFSAAEVHLL